MDTMLFLSFALSVYSMAAETTTAVVSVGQLVPSQPVLLVLKQNAHFLNCVNSCQFLWTASVLIQILDVYFFISETSCMYL